MVFKNTGLLLLGAHRLLGAGVLGDGLGALRHGVLGQLSREQKADSRLDLAGGDGGALVVGSELGGLAGNALEDIVDEGVQDGHGLVGDTGVGVDLLEDLVDVGGVSLLPGLSPLLLGLAVSSSGGLCGLLGLGLRGGFGGSLGGSRGRGLSGGGSWLSWHL